MLGAQTEDCKFATTAATKAPVLYTFLNMNSSVWAVWAAQTVREKNVDLSFSEQLFGWFFSTFCGQNLFFYFFENIAATTLKSYIK